jgi:hypothetical protein
MTRQFSPNDDEGDCPGQYECDKCYCHEECELFGSCPFEPSMSRPGVGFTCMGHDSCPFEVTT